MRTIRASIRLLLFFASSIGAYLVWFVTHRFVPNKIFLRQVIFRTWSRSFVRMCNIQIEVRGTPPKPPFFVVCNHLSYADIPVLRAVVKGVFLAKKDVEDWPIGGRICRDMGTVFIDRENRRDIPRAGELVLERLRQGEGVIVFPEGTSTKGETVLPFNSSFLEFAARAEQPVSYASISYRTPEGELPASTAVCWWDDTELVPHMFRLFKLPSYTATIEFGDEALIGKDRKLLARELHARVLASFTPID